MHAKMTIRLRSHTTIRKRVLDIWFSLFECGARIRGGKGWGRYPLSTKTQWST